MRQGYSGMVASEIHEGLLSFRILFIVRYFKEKKPNTSGSVPDTLCSVFFFRKSDN
jgi:hypothetical protein